MALSDEARDELRAQFGDETVLVDKTDAGIGAFVFRKPGAIAWERFQDALMSDKKGHKKSSSFAQLCRDCLVYPLGENGKPDMGKLGALFEAFPGIATTITGELSDLAGAGESHVGKL